MAAFALTGLLTVVARAHDVLPSALALSFRPGAVDATLLLPVAQLGLALAATWHDPTLERLAEDPERFDAAFAERVRTYVRAYVGVEDERPIAYRTEVSTPRWAVQGGAPQIVVDLTFHAPDGHEPARLTVHDEVISQEVVTHRTLVSVEHDFERGRFAASHQVVATLRYGQRAVALDRSDASVGRGIAAMVELGARHVAEGIDHLLFVLVLLVPAPLVATRLGQKSVWHGRRTTRSALRHLFVLISAFTLGHSLTLLLGTSGWVRMPEKPVEIAIGVSIALGAWHAIRPVVPGKESAVALGFGLVHGLAFASTLQGFGLRGSALVMALCAFNVGIELIQLALVLSVAPFLMVAARRESYRWLSRALAGGALCAAGCWIVQRATGRANPGTELLDSWSARPLTVWLALLGSLLAWAAATRLAAGLPSGLRRTLRAAPSRRS